MVVIELVLVSLERSERRRQAGTAVVGERVSSRLHASAGPEGAEALCGVTVQRVVWSFEPPVPQMFADLIPRPREGYPVLALRGASRELVPCNECRHKAWALEDERAS